MRPATTQTRSWTADSRNWDHYRPRNDDIVIATYPKCGTTWMQRIVGMLVLQSTKPVPLMEISPWLERRSDQLFQECLTTIAAQKHRRFLKTHLPFESLPFYDEVKYIHVVRDGRDALLSWYHFAGAFPEEFLTRMDANGLADDLIGRPFPRACSTASEEFHRWLTQALDPQDNNGLPNDSFFRNTQSWWQQRNRTNILFVHFNDLKLDLLGEMRRVAQFLDISLSDEQLVEYAEAAGFAAMKRDGAKLLPVIGDKLIGGANSFLRKGENREWETLFDPADLDLYEKLLSQSLSPDCANWVTNGRSEAA